VRQKIIDMKIAVIGATGLVGQVILDVLEERHFPCEELIPVASERSIGHSVEFQGDRYLVINIEDALKEEPDIALFSCGSALSKEYAPKFAKRGCTVVDNSSAWRTSPDHKLIVPEINAHELKKEDLIIANPNCSTIQMVMALKPLHDAFTVKRVVVSTYQSITGSGMKALRQMENERKGEKAEMAYPYQIDQNCLPHCDVFLENDYTKEEMKLVNETQKILDPNIRVTATAVRVPVMGGHSESLNIEFEKEPDITQVRKLLKDSPGVTLQDNPDVNNYPMPIMAMGKDDVFVGRIRKDESQPNTINMWVVSDNLRKGAATNAVQIAEYLYKNKLIKNSYAS
jgi:aspartate-semialdehyde dehydrogenase